MARDTREQVAAALAAAFLAGGWHLRLLLARGAEVLDAGGPWLREVAADVLTRWREPPLDDHRGLGDFVRQHRSFLDAWRRREVPRRVAHYLSFEPKMRPTRWPVPTLHTSGDVAAWLGLSDRELTWFSDPSGVGRHRRQARAGHYTQVWLARGERLPRLLEAPRPRLKALQRRVLRELLQALPAHEAAHGFVPGRSVLTLAALHVGRPVVVRFDLRHFFTSVRPARAFGVLRSLGYPYEVASPLLGLCTTRTPPAVLARAPVPVGADGAVLNQRFFMLRALETWHLPQGAPTSPAWANLCAWWLDARLSAWARAAGLAYSRYADDLVFSGPEALPLQRLSVVVDAVARDEGFLVNVEKTRVMRQSQRQEVTGVVVNARPNVSRADYDALKALLHRCVKKGPNSQSTTTVEALRAHLMGRVAWVAQLNPARGEKLRRELARIDFGQRSAR